MVPMLGLCSSCPDGVCPEDFDVNTAMMNMVLGDCASACPGLAAVMALLEEDDGGECSEMETLRCVAAGPEGCEMMAGDANESLASCECARLCPETDDVEDMVGLVLGLGADVENATKWDQLCPIEGDIRCLVVTNAAVCGNDQAEVVTEVVTPVLALLEGCAESWEPRALSVVLTMAMTVADPAAFVEAETSKAAVEQGIADAAGVSPDKVTATLTVGSRRLQASDRRLEGTVDVSAEIEADNAAAVTALQSSVAAIEPTAMTESLNTALESAGLPAVVVASLAAAVAEPPARYVAPAPAPPAGESREELPSGESFALKSGLSLLGVAFITGSLMA